MRPTGSRARPYHWRLKDGTGSGGWLSSEDVGRQRVQGLLVLLDAAKEGEAQARRQAEILGVNLHNERARRQDVEAGLASARARADRLKEDRDDAEADAREAAEDARVLRASLLSIRERCRRKARQIREAGQVSTKARINARIGVEDLLEDIGTGRQDLVD